MAYRNDDDHNPLILDPPYHPMIAKPPTPETRKLARQGLGTLSGVVESGYLSQPFHDASTGRGAELGELLLRRRG